MDLQMILVYLAVGVALFYIIRKMRKTVVKGDSPSCDKCEPAAQKKT